MSVDEVYAIFARPVPVLGMALARIALGLVLAYDGVRMLREHDAWYGADALRPPRSILPRALDAFAWVERLGGSSRTVLRVLVTSAVLFACGFATNLAGAVLLACAIAVMARNSFVAYGADAFACTVVLLLMCSPCGEALSVDRWIADRTLGLTAQAPPWGGQLVRLEVAALYLGNFVAKIRSPAWRRGTVLFDLLRNRNFARAGVPRWLMRRDAARAATWGALAAELVFAPALLYGPTAAYACVAAIAFHLAIAWLVDVHLFSAVMIAALLACWPAEATLPVPPIDGWHAAALVLALGYLAWAVLADLGLLGRAGSVRGWRMFTGSTPSVVDVEITVLDAHGDKAKWLWAHLDDLCNRTPARCGHRFQRFQFALLHDPDARARVSERFRAGVERSDRTPRAWSIDVWVRGVHDEAVLAGVNVGVGIGTSEVRR